VAERNHRTFTATCAALKLHGACLGLLGEIDPQVLLNFDIAAGARVYAAEIRIKQLIRPSWQIQPLAPISNYQPVVEDLAFLVPEDVTAAQVLEAIRRAGGSTLASAELFDVYRGSPIPADRKSLAYKLTYESVDAPLKDAQVVGVRKRIIRRVGEAVGGTLRE
jgi:phenylalanyl-tRNA synthetase beta chain